jgi:hypothetical protein
MVGQTVARRSHQIAALLGSPEIDQLVSELAAARWTGRSGYAIRTMVGMALAKSLYTLPTWTRTVALVCEHAALRAALGCPDLASVPSVHACYRFTAKLRAFKPLLDACLDRVTAALHEQIPDLGATVAIDASDMPAYANGQRYLYKGGPERKRYADPDAAWGHRSAVSTRAAGSFYGYKLHQVVCGVPRRDRHHGHGRRPRDRRRAVRGPRLPPRHPAARDPRRQGRQAPAAGLRARHLDLRWVGRQAAGGQVALPDGCVLAREPVGQGGPVAHPDPPGDRPVEEAVPAARVGRARERPAQARVRAVATAGPAD